MPEPITLPDVLSVQELADALKVPVVGVIGKLIGFGVVATINQDIDFDTASIVADDYGIQVKREASRNTAVKQADLVDASVETATRAPVVTIMGHVDHGKTSLLDAIRSTNVAAKESGGITQHISSYQVQVAPKAGGEARTLTFLDTPGHSAFEAMRRHGARITDLVVLAVAADDGVKPQTIEAIKHARQMNVPILVALTKIDKPDANPDVAKASLAEHDLAPEEWGGKTVVVPVSSKTKEGLPELLEMILLATDLRELVANPDVPAVGVVVESHQQPGVGAVATVLVQNGTLKVGDYLAIGDVAGRVRTLTDHRGERIESAGASVPVEVSGLSAVPGFGEQLSVYASERDARDAAKRFLRKSTAKRAVAKDLALGGGSAREGDLTILNVVLRADTNGSLEALKEGLLRFRNSDVEVRIVAEGIGDVTEGDITMAKTANAPVIGFHTRLPAAVKSLADQEKVQVLLFTVIYELFDTVRDTLAGLMPEIEIEDEKAQLTVLARFRDNRKRVVCGGRVESGSVLPKLSVKVLRKGEEVNRGRLVTLRQGKQETRQVNAGSECGLELDLRGSELEVRDMLVFFETSRQRKELSL